MPDKLKIGIVGCGAIGSSLADFIHKDLREHALLVALFDIDYARALGVSRMISPGKNRAVKDLSRLCRVSGLVIEAASAASAWPVARAALKSGRDCMIMSVGGLIGHVRQMRSLARRAKARVYIPSGALCGIDGLKASAMAGIKQVALTTRKHPLSFEGVAFVENKGIDLRKITHDTVLFHGPASEAVKHFPQNINVAAVLSLAGIGAQKTEVKIIASPSVKHNEHEVEIVSCAGRIRAMTKNELHPGNRKTSYLAVLSAAAVLRQLVDPVRIGT